MPYVKVLEPPSVWQGHLKIRVGVWQNQGQFQAGQPPIIAEDWDPETRTMKPGAIFLFARATPTISQRKADAQGRFLMDNGQVAPVHTAQTARDALVATDPLLALLDLIVAGLPPTFTNRDAIIAKRNELLVARGSDLVGEQFLPAGRTWQMETVPSVTPEEIKETIARRIQQVLSVGAGESLVQRPEIQQIGTFEGDV